MSVSDPLSQHLATRTKNFLSRAHLAPTSTRARPAPARMTLRVPALAPQMRVPVVTRSAQDSSAYTVHPHNHVK